MTELGFKFTTLGSRAQAFSHYTLYSQINQFSFKTSLFPKGPISTGSKKIMTTGIFLNIVSALSPVSFSKILPPSSTPALSDTLMFEEQKLLPFIGLI